MYRKSKILLAFVLLGIALTGLAGCAGSKSSAEETEQVSSQDDYDEIERILGITPEDKSVTPAESEGDDLLQLLQANETEGSPTQSEAPAEEPLEDARIRQLNNEITELKKEVREKNKTIADLKAQVMALENEPQAGGSTYSPAVSSSPGYTTPSGGSDGEYERTYQEGFQLAMNHQYREAIRVFESMLATRTDHSLSDNAQYWIGECLYALGDYRGAIIAFEKVFTFKNSNKNDYAQYKLGLCYYRLNEPSRARQEFQTLIDNYQTSELLAKAEEYMAKL